MPIWESPPVDLESEIDLILWRIMQTERGEQHQVGIRTDFPTGRVSTAIAEFDPESRRGVTRSGRVYQLYGELGCSAGAEYVWNQWCLANSIHNATDITHIAANATAGPRYGIQS
ncbi:hypothetical protein PQR70_36725 [Paraburkholderia madseniana]|uniref:hypothetical protein n=1 Tax=Paraburkholderia madseniana TaxID=2599607 RepID=UPI0038B9ABBA